jgi:hypothetical protein
MTNLDQIVRPFQSPLIAPSPSRQPAKPGAREAPGLEIGRDGRTKTFTGSENATTTSFCQRIRKERSAAGGGGPPPIGSGDAPRRKQKERRVENPDDPNQYVKVKDTYVVQKEGGSGQDYFLEYEHFDNPKEGESSGPSE